MNFFKKIIKRNAISIGSSILFIITATFLGINKGDIWGYLTAPENFIIVLYLCAFLALFPFLMSLIDDLLGYAARRKAINNGANRLYQEETAITFADIARKWGKLSGCTDEDVFDYLLRAFWLGKFEHKNESILTITYPKSRVSEVKFTAPHFAYPEKSDELKRTNMLIACAVWEGGKMSDIRNAVANGESEEKIYEKMRNLRLSDYEETMRTAYWSAMTLPQSAFIIWLRNSKVPIPKEWYDSH